jgi:hypothetical protein
MTPEPISPLNESMGSRIATAITRKLTTYRPATVSTVEATRIWTMFSAPPCAATWRKPK